MPSSDAPTENYGIDSPMIVMTFLGAAAAMVIIGVVVATGSTAGAAIGPVLGALVLLGGAGLMIRGSRSGKSALWDKMLDGVALTGREDALDVGCGRGLVAVKLARRLPKKTVSAIDLWRPRDQSGNSRAAAEANAAAAGVADRIDFHDGDMRELPFADGSFDIVTSSQALHHLPLAADRAKAMKEIIRVLRPGGVVMIGDVSKLLEYAAWLEDAGFVDLERSSTSFATYPPTRFVQARKPKR